MRKETFRRIAAVLLACFAAAGCASVAKLNEPLAPEALRDTTGPISRGGYRLTSLPITGSPDVLVLLAFSGGGKRSAAFGYGVLRGLRDFPIVAGGQQRRLLDEVDMMASVSGGSFPAAYYGLYRDKIFTDFEKDFLNQDVEAYIWGTFLIPWHLGWLFDPNFGTNDRMAEVYDKLMFHGATFADLLRAGRPLVSINATDVDHGYAFSFHQDQFDLICSDLTSYPIARAVAASNGFPVLFTPITLKSYRPNCYGREPAWVKDDRSNDPLSRVHEQAQVARAYLDPDRTRYVHLLDGGVADNLAMRGMINMGLILAEETETAKRLDLRHIRRILMISADGQAATDESSAREQHLSGLGQILNAVSGTTIDSYNFETMILAKQAMDELRDTIRKQRCARGPTAPDGTRCDDVESYFAHLSLAGVPDEAERRRLEKIPTGLTIDRPDIESLIRAGEEQVKASPVLASFRDNLGSPPALPAGRTMPATASTDEPKKRRHDVAIYARRRPPPSSR
jgi:NTE family protein